MAQSRVQSPGLVPPSGEIGMVKGRRGGLRLRDEAGAIMFLKCMWANLDILVINRQCWLITMALAIQLVLTPIN